MGDIVIQEEIKKLIEEIDVSDSNYEKATNRYNSIANYIKNLNLIQINQIYICKARLNLEQQLSL